MTSATTYPTIDSTHATAATDHLQVVDPLLAPAIQKAGICPIRPHTNYYQELVEAIVGQQLSVKAAASIQRRFNSLFLVADETTGSQAATQLFPTPDQIVAMPDEPLRAAGLSRAKVIYIKDLSAHVMDGRLQFEHFAGLSNQEISRQLTTIKGIGEWTADMFLFFCMARSDVLPYGDLGIRSGMRQLYGLSELPNRQQMQDLASANHWAPYTTIACWYIWQHLDNEPAKA